jgi:DNA polymerase I-like protein with 3'-5' exonuclease and polymerase domains
MTDVIDVADLFADEAEHVDAKLPWMDEKEFILGTPDNLAQIMDWCIESGKYALDLETTGLDNRVYVNQAGIPVTVDKIAGVCLSPDGVKGIYIPIGHVVKTDEGTAIKGPHPANVPLDLFDTEFKRLIQATEEGKTVAVFQNGKFDQEFLQFNETGVPWGIWDIPSQWEDTLILAYLRNTRARHKGLKELSGASPDAGEDSQTGGPGLGMEMIPIHILFGHKKKQKGFKYDFSSLDPSDAVNLWYAGSDAICTWLLEPVLKPPVVDLDTDGISQATVYKIEKACVAATRWMERNRIHVNMDAVCELVGLGQGEWFESVKIVYEEAEKLLGRDVMPRTYQILLRQFQSEANPENLIRHQLDNAEREAKRLNKLEALPDKPPPIEVNGKEWPIVYDINSQQQLGTMFDEMGIPGLKRTEKSGQVATGKAELKRILDETGDKFPFMGKIRRFREVSKALSTYLEPMLQDSDPTDHTMRINFQGFKVDTGRFSTPAKDSVKIGSDRHRMEGWPRVNVQATPNRYDPDRPACMNRLRECYSARPVSAGDPPKFTLAIDYAGVELRLVTNLSREPLWLTEFFHCSTCDRMFERTQREGTQSITPVPPPGRCPNCGSDKIGDLHSLTGISLFGAESVKRSDWKKLRGNAKATNFALCYGGGGNAVVRATKVDKQEGQRIKRAFDRTYNGLSKWWRGQHARAKKFSYVRTAFGRRYPVPDIHSADRGFMSKAQRNSVNGPIQGSSADVTKVAMALVYKEMRNRGWLDKVQMIITMHDELVFEVDGDVMEECIPILVELMVENPFVLGMNWPVPLTADVEIGIDWTVPWDLNEMRHGEVRFIGDTKYGKPEKLPPGQNWDTLPSWPESLRPWFKEAQGQAPVSATPISIPSTPAPTEGPDTPEQPQQVETAPESTPAPQPMPEIPVAEGEFLFHLTAPMDTLTAVKLGTIIAKATRTRGTRKLRIMGPDGKEITGWEDALGQIIKVSPVQFLALAEVEGL